MHILVQSKLHFFIFLNFIVDFELNDYGQILLQDEFIIKNQNFLKKLFSNVIVL